MSRNNKLGSSNTNYEILNFYLFNNTMIKTGRNHSIDTDFNNTERLGYNLLKI